METGMEEQLTENLKNTSNWLRLLFMLLFAAFYSIAEIVLLVVIAFQFLCKLISGSANERALAFGAQLSTYVYQTFMYLTYNTEERPFPFANWPTIHAKANLPSHTRRGRPRKTAAADAETEKPVRKSSGKKKDATAK